MEYEVFTIGGGRLLFEVFNAITSIVNGAAFGVARTLALLLAGGWMAFQVGFNPVKGWGGIPTYFAASIIIVSGLLAPVAEVKITDRISQIDSSGYIIDNVPFGLAFFASMTSQVGNGLTNLFESNLAGTGDPRLTEGGFLFGAKLLAEATRVEVKDELLDYNIRRFMRQCVFYDILQGRKSFETLRSHANPWGYMTGNPSGMRMMEFRTREGTDGFKGTVYTCAQAVPLFSTAFTAEITKASNRLARAFLPESAFSARNNITPALARTYVTTELAQMHNYLIGASRTSVQILQRQMAINAYHAERENWLAETDNGAALQAYRDARLQIQTRQSYDSVARQAERWVPLLKTVFQVIYYGSFPVAVLLMLTPMWAQIFRNYFMGFVWIESWGPLYAILHFVMYEETRNRMRAAVEETGGGDIPLVAQAGIQIVEADVSNMAGYLMMSVPFIALMIAYGARQGLHLAQSTLAVTQEAVGETSRETATGNLSIGNTQADTHQWTTRTGLQQNESISQDVGRSTSYDADGTQRIVTSNGNVVTNQEGFSSSRLAGNLNLGHGVNERLTENQGEATRLVADARTAHGHQESANQQQLDNFADSFIEQHGLNRNYEAGSGTESREGLTATQRGVYDLVDQSDLTVSQAAKTFASAELGYGFGKSSIKGGISGEGGVAGTDLARAVEQYTQSEDLQDAVSASLNTRIATTSSDGESSSQTYGESLSVGFNKQQSLDENISSALANEQSVSRAKERYEALSADSSVNFNQNFSNWLRETKGGDASQLLSPNSTTEERLELSELQNQYVKEEILPALHRDDWSYDDVSSQFKQQHSQSAHAIEHEADIEGVHRTYSRDLPKNPNADGALQDGQARVQADVEAQQNADNDRIGQGKDDLRQRENRVTDKTDDSLNEGFTKLAGRSFLTDRPLPQIGSKGND